MQMTKLRNPIDHNVLNSFTEILKARCLESGHVNCVLRCGQVVPVYYFKRTKDRNEQFAYISERQYLVWKLCGRSISSERFDIVEFAD